MDCILLHGWGVSSSVWGDFKEDIRSFENISTPCLYELAIKSKEKSVFSLAKIIESNIKTDSIVIAWSLGGLIATHLSVLTNKVKAIVFIASSPCFINQGDWSNVIEEYLFYDLQNKLLKNTENTLNYFSGLIAHGDLSSKETNKFIRQNLADKKHKETLLSLLVEMRKIDLRKEFKNINIPTIIILGKNDSLINSNIEPDIRLLNPNVRREVLDDCGHAPFISKKHETSKIINEFISALSL